MSGTHRLGFVRTALTQVDTEDHHRADREELGLPILQSLTPEELELSTTPVTLYPRPPAVRAWVRFGAQHTRVDAKLLRSTDQAAGIEFVVKGKPYRC